MDRENFSEQILCLESRLYHAAKTILHNDEDCADAIQNAILKAWQKLDTLQEEDRFAAWMTRIVINECYQFFRKNAGFVSLDAFPGWDAEAISGAYEESEALLTLMKLEEKYRVPIVLHIVEGYSQKETAEILGLTEAAVKSRIHRGRKLLKKFL